MSTGTWYTLTLTASGSAISGRVNGATRLTATDTAFAAGSIGLATNYASASFDDVTATTTSRPVPATTAPSAVPSSARPSASASPSASPSATPTTTGGNPGPNQAHGFASVNALGQNGTTGGAGGPVVTVTSADQLIDTIARPGPYVIMVSGSITLPTGTTDGMYSVASDKSIIGIGANAQILNDGFTIGLPVDDAMTAVPANAVHNVIIRNLSFSGQTDDQVNVQMFSHHVWVDHNDFGDDDGSVDIRRGSDFVTISWNRTHDHDKTMLLGHDDENGRRTSGTSG